MPCSPSTGKVSPRLDYVTFVSRGARLGALVTVSGDTVRTAPDERASIMADCRAPATPGQEAGRSVACGTAAAAGGVFAGVDCARHEASNSTPCANAPKAPPHSVPPNAPRTTATPVGSRISHGKNFANSPGASAAAPQPNSPPSSIPAREASVTCTNTRAAENLRCSIRLMQDLVHPH